VRTLLHCRCRKEGLTAADVFGAQVLGAKLGLEEQLLDQFPREHLIEIGFAGRWWEHRHRGGELLKMIHGGASERMRTEKQRAQTRAETTKKSLLRLLSAENDKKQRRRTNCANRLRKYYLLVVERTKGVDYSHP